MGAWGYGIRQDDFVLDVVGIFEDLLKAGQSVPDATETVKTRFVAETNDSDDGPLLWLALADVQWTCGALTSEVLNHVQSDFDSGRSLDAWREDARGLLRRKAALEKFIRKIGIVAGRASDHDRSGSVGRTASSKARPSRSRTAVKWRTSRVAMRVTPRSFR